MDVVCTSNACKGDDVKEKKLMLAYTLWLMLVFMVAMSRQIEFKHELYEDGTLALVIDYPDERGDFGREQIVKWVCLPGWPCED